MMCNLFAKHLCSQFNRITIIIIIISICTDLSSTSIPSRLIRKRNVHTSHNPPVLAGGRYNTESN